MLQLQPAEPPAPLYRFQREYWDGPVTTSTPYSNFLKGVKWSPDGLCFLTASDDNWFRIYDTPPEALAAPSHAAAAAAGAGAEAEAAAGAEAATGAATDTSTPAAFNTADGTGGEAPPDSFGPALRVEEGELIYDYAWFPRMVASEPASCCFASTSRAHPLHLWDACTGELRCTYRAYDAADEVTAANSLAFDPDGARLLCGFNRCIRAFDVSRPGRDYATVVTYQKKQEGQPGIISCLAFNPDRSGMVAAGSYSGVAALYDAAPGGAGGAGASLIAVLEGQAGGITQVQFSACGNYLYTGARRDPALHCWDVRFSSGVVYTITRATAATNQRIQFDIEPGGRHLATGGEDGMVRLFDLRDGSEARAFRAADDTLNGCSFHPYLPLLATASGHRRFPLAPDSSSDEEEEITEGEGVNEASTALGAGPQPPGGAQPGAAAALDSLGAAGAGPPAMDEDRGGEGAALPGGDGGGGGGAGARQQRGQLGPLDNVLRVWRLQAVAPEEGTWEPESMFAEQPVASADEAEGQGEALEPAG